MIRSTFQMPVCLAFLAACVAGGPVAATETGAFAFSKGSFAAPGEGAASTPPAGVAAGYAADPTEAPVQAPGLAGMGGGEGRRCVLCPIEGAPTAASAFRLGPMPPTDRVWVLAPSLLSPNTGFETGSFGSGSFEGDREPARKPEKPEAAERTEKPEKPETPDKAEKPETPDKAEKPEAPDKTQAKPVEKRPAAKDDTFAVNDFDKQRDEQRKGPDSGPKETEQKPDERPRARPDQPEKQETVRKEPEKKPEDTRRRERVDNQREPGGDDDFGPAKDFERRERRDDRREAERREREQPERQVERRERETPRRETPRREAQPRQTGPVVDPGVTAFELRSFGVQPTSQLRQQYMHGGTPTQLPGGHLITTERLARAMVKGEKFVLIDVLHSDFTLPKAWQWRGMASGGHFRDDVQQNVARWLAQQTGRNANYPIVVFCSDPMCWLSYNAGLRAIAAGYRNVYWYRGGLRAWQMAGFRMVASGQ